MVFQTAGFSAPVWLPPLISFAVSFFTSMGGVSGAFLLLPIQLICFGHAHPSISATNQMYNIMAIPSGVYRYWRERRVVIPLTGAITAGLLPGVLLGVVLRTVWLPDAARFKLFAAMVLLYVGVDMVRGLIHGAVNTAEQKEGANNSDDDSHGVSSHLFGECSHQRPVKIRYNHKNESFDISLPAVSVFSLLIGLIAGAYGIGGGAIIAPLLVSRFGIPVHGVAGAALTASLASSIAAVAGYNIIAPWYPDMSIAPDWTLGLLLGSGGMAGMYLGARSQKYVSAQKITWVLAAIVICLAVSYIAVMFV
jgi:hypothetical protein